MATTGLKRLSVSIDTLLIDISYHFKYSAKRWTEYSEIEAAFDDIKALKHCTTRWLSLERCVKHLINKWPALYSYFDLETTNVTANARVYRIAKQLEDPSVKLQGDK